LFTTSKNRQTQRLEFLQKKLGSCIQKAKPYYESIELTERLQYETQKAVIDFQKANSLYKTAKETMQVAESSLDTHEIPDVWQEHLSTTVAKINQSKRAADQAEENHRYKAIEYQMAEKRSQFLEKDLKRSIAKSKLYYEEKDRWNTQMEAQKMRIHELEKALIQTKKNYKEAMINLSKISEDIHSKRKQPLAQQAIQEQIKPTAYHLDESHHLNSCETEKSQLKRYLDLYKISLPTEQEQTNSEKISEYLNKNDLKADTIDSLEYVSLGLNSTASNSRCSSPNSNNSIATDPDVLVGICGGGGGGSVNNHHNVSSSSSNRHHTNAITTSNTLNQAINSLELLSDKSELSSKTNSFSSSSMSRASSSNEYHTTLRATPHRSMTIDTGFRSISSDFDIKGSVGYESFEEPPMPSSSIKQIINATNKSNLTTTGSFNSNDLTVTASSASSLTSTNSAPTIKSKLENSNKQINSSNNNKNNNNNNRPTNQETPLLTNLLNHHSHRF
jgi:hypothetical protein